MRNRNRQKRYVTFYKIGFHHLSPTLSIYGMMCSRSWRKCLKLGIRHIRQGKATFFTIEKVKPKRGSLGS